MKSEVLKRSEQKVENTWNLADIYATTADYDADLKAMMEECEAFAKNRSNATNSAKNLLQSMDAIESVQKRAYRLVEYAQRLSDQDTGDNKNLERVQILMAQIAKIDEKMAFFDPELIALSEETMNQYYAKEPGLEKYRIYMTEVRRVKEHSLSPELEELLASASQTCDAPEEIYGLFTDADMIFPEIDDEDGKKVRITHGRFVPLQESSDRRVRKDAFEAHYGVYKQYKNALAAMYSAQVKQLMFKAKARKYSSTLEAALDRNHVDTKVYHNLVEAINERMGLMHRYVSLRKKMLGVDELHMYDVYVPLVQDVAVTIPFETAKETVLKALAPLGERYISLLKEGFENRWIDVYENEGKRSGAYSAGCYGVHPYVLLNYNETLDNQFTLAHEMGHSLHSYFSNEGQEFLDSQYKIFVAEVASTVNEVLLIEYLLKTTTDKKQRIYLLNHYLNSFKSTVYRQTMFAEFEMLTNEMAERGESLNADTLSNTYLELNKKYFGPDMISDEEIAYEWSRIPHFYYNFYVFQYATGYSAAVAIARRILKEGQSAVDDYMKFLHSGCTDAPVELLKIAGVDMSTKKPILSALDVFEEILDQIEKEIDEQ